MTPKQIKQYNDKKSIIKNFHQKYYKQISYAQNKEKTKNTNTKKKKHTHTHTNN